MLQCPILSKSPAYQQEGTQDRFRPIKKTYHNKSGNVIAYSKYQKIKRNSHVACIYFRTPLLPSSYISLTFMFICFSKENRLQIFHYCNRSVHTTMNNDQNKYTALQICRGKQSPWRCVMAGKRFKAERRCQALFIPSRTFHLRQDIPECLIGRNVPRTTNISFTVGKSYGVLRRLDW